MNIEELTEKYKNKIDVLMKEYNNKLNELEETKEKSLIIERRKLQSQIEMFAKLNNKEKINWDNNQENWFIYIDYDDNHVGIDKTYNYRGLNATYFSSYAVAQKALEKFGDRIKELYIDTEKDN